LVGFSSEFASKEEATVQSVWEQCPAGVHCGRDAAGEGIFPGLEEGCGQATQSHL